MLCSPSCKPCFGQNRPLSADEGLEILKNEPAKANIQKYYVPTKTSGWFIQNQYREELINLKLKECDMYKYNIKDAAERVAMPPEPVKPEISFLQNPYVITVMVLASGYVGYQLKK